MKFTETGAEVTSKSHTHPESDDAKEDSQGTAWDDSRREQYERVY